MISCNLIHELFTFSFVVAVYVFTLYWSKVRMDYGFVLIVGSI